MRLTPFGEAVRLLRMKFDLSLKAMAEAMGISSAHLSGIEYGEKRLSDKHIEAAISFFSSRANADQLQELQLAADRSKDMVNTSELDADARGLVAAFARRLQEGEAPSEEIRNWLNKRDKKEE
ncbi:helix-turn-helix domain-containing protein [Azotobacter chroococcum]|uniref:helix-turn-helix domain-containing protein n=1 Tax=Azotobacter chroococcum TaxID=353 RepID=UPI00103DB191|nr:helix-turn-helix transcriptional regulator [Azotobacter chroococcum]TBV97758.1 XRE family transcriptional regulator [Azotobacter chroococcum]